MLFNSLIFIFLFLPIVLIVFHLIGDRGHHRIAVSWLVAASLFFYSWWNPTYLVLILASILFNYAIGISLGRKSSKLVLFTGIIANLTLLGYFKYAVFFVANFNILTQSNIHLETIILPLAISFFTFQQITYLIDAYRGLTKEHSFLHYCLFVTFFPQLIAGPIVHHKDMMPQFANDALYKLKTSHLSIGISIFMLGLFKKVVFADNIALYGNPVFEAAESGISLTIFEAWGGALAYTFQLYFDFSGYSDMAIGLARMFGVVLPINFYSPYKSNSIIEFWKTWHITLSRFLRDYVYIPLGGNRKGQIRRFTNIIITMLLGGLWHGAGWTFIIWGSMHGAFLFINHIWNMLIIKIFSYRNKPHFLTKVSGRLLTFTSVVVAWVMFRAESLNGAITMYSGMFGFNGISLPNWSESKIKTLGELPNKLNIDYSGMFHNRVFDSSDGVAFLIILLLIVWFTPNTLDWFKNENPALGLNKILKKQQINISWKPKIIYSLILILISTVALLFIQQESEFLYFQF